MTKKTIFFAVLFYGTVLNAQNAISGHIDWEDGASDASRIYLVKLDLSQLENIKYGKEVTWSQVADDGSFSFQKKHFADKDAVYQLYVHRLEKALRDSLVRSTPFILSNRDSMHFDGGDAPFSVYSTSNLADKEWKRLREFEMGLERAEAGSHGDFPALKGYTKDSLQILIVKLIGIRQLADKSLLDQDIAKNPDYYLALLAELRESGLPSRDFAFLEKHMAYLSIEEVQRDFALSKTINILLGTLVLGLVGFIVIGKRRKPILSDLSKQERNVQNLILAGKSNKEIANELFISLSTVKTHITSIYSKLQVSNRQELLQKGKI